MSQGIAEARHFLAAFCFQNTGRVIVAYSPNDRLDGLNQNRGDYGLVSKPGNLPSRGHVGDVVISCPAVTTSRFFFNRCFTEYSASACTHWDAAERGEANRMK
jgi:hypothetical protein